MFNLEKYKLCKKLLWKHLYSRLNIFSPGLSTKYLDSFKLENMFISIKFFYSEQIKMEINKERKRLDDSISQINKEFDSAESDRENNEIDENGNERLNLPKKFKYRMRAHCNPLAGVSMAL